MALSCFSGHSQDQIIWNDDDGDHGGDGAEEEDDEEDEDEDEDEDYWNAKHGPKSEVPFLREFCAINPSK